MRDAAPPPHASRISHPASRKRGRPHVTQTVDLLAIAAHRDDAELTCGGTLAKAVRAGHRLGTLDLTQAEPGTPGDAGLRTAKAERAGRALGVPVPLNAGLPDPPPRNDQPS